MLKGHTQMIPVMRRTVAYWRPALGLLVLLVLGPACDGSGESSQPNRDAGNSWSHIKRIERYVLRGSVLEGQDLSGIAGVSPTWYLIGADEGGSVQVVELSRPDRTLQVRETIALAGGGAEIDIEGIAADGETYYIVGSHGVAKKSGERQADRYRIFRLRVNPITGMPVGQVDTALAAASLSGLLQADPILRSYFGQPLQEKGVNIEAWRFAMADSSSVYAVPTSTVTSSSLRCERTTSSPDDKNRCTR
jgi:hypothetical protein